MIYSILSSSVTLCPALMVVEENKKKYYFQLSVRGPGEKPHKLQESLQYYLIEKNSNIRLLRKLIGSQVPAEL